MTPNISRIRRVIEEFQDLNYQFESNRWHHNQVSFDKLISGWKTIQIMAAHIEKLTAPNYNVFSIMKNMESNEVKLHSPFLADLFNINGEHKQGDLFYRELIMLLKLDPKIYQPKDTRWLQVRTEAASGTGSIDILINYRKEQHSFAIAIENKIYAGDQIRQLERYHRYLHAEFGKQFVLIYLTPEGRIASEYSASTSFLEQYSIPCMSYRIDIVELLQKTIPQIQAANVRTVVEQYLAVCQRI